MNMYDLERVSGVIDQWLRDELVDSKEGRNGFLDNHDSFRESLLLEGNYPLNFDAVKGSAHFSHFENLLSLRASGIHNEFTLAKITHHALRFVSGGFRANAYLRAWFQEQYENLRFGRKDEPNGAVSIDLASVVEETWDGFIDRSSGNTLGTFIGEARTANQLIFDGLQATYHWMNENNAYKSALDEESLPVQITNQRQKLGIGIAVSHIALVTLENGGDLSRVPMLEPKSITDVSPNPHYPFA